MGAPRDSATGRTPIDPRAPLPREGFLLAAALAAAVVWAAFRVVSSGDLWVALGCGRYMLQHGVGRTDPFSFTSPPGTWINQNWLSHVLFTLIHQAAGLDGIGIWRLLVTATIIGSVGWTALRLGSSRTMAALAAIAVGIAGRYYVDARPNLHTIAMSAALLAWIAAGGLARPRRYFVPIAMAVLWSNLHGGFLFGILALGAASGVQALREKRPVPSLLLPAAAVLAALVSPYGITNLTHPWEVSAGEAAGHWRTVAEWRSSAAPGALHDPGVRAFWILLSAGVAAMALAIGRSRRAKDRDSSRFAPLLPFAAVSLLACALALTSRRFVPLFAVAAAPAIAAVLSQALPAIRLRGPIAVALGVALLAGAGVDFAERLVVANGLWTRSVPWSSRIVRLDEQPTEAAEFVVSSGIRGRLFVEWLWGGQLLYKAPFEDGKARYRIFIDGRAQAAYPVAISTDYAAMEAAAARRDLEAIRALLDRYEIDSCLLDRRGPGLAAIIPEMQGWVGVYADEKALVVVRESVARTIEGGRFPDPAIRDASAAFRLRTGGGRIEEAMEYAIRSVRARPTTVGVTELTRLALAASTPETIARATAECDRLLSQSIDPPASAILTTRANTAQCRSVLARRSGDESGAARFHATALRLAEEADRIGPRYLR